LHDGHTGQAPYVQSTHAKAECGLRSDRGGGRVSRLLHLRSRWLLVNDPLHRLGEHLEVARGVHRFWFRG
jgi:hypothetical protein